jgi:hypothetical protein
MYTLLPAKWAHRAERSGRANTSHPRSSVLDRTTR